MTTMGQAHLGARSTREVRTDRPATSLRFDYAMALLLLWMIVGAFLDGWAHNHFGNDLDTFFTPWHGTLYSGFFAVMALTLGTCALNIRKGYDWRKAVPGGYELSVIGVMLFFIGGVGDLLWHELIGIEVNIEAAYSPTHQLLLISMVMVALGPLRSALRQDDATTSFRRFFPAALSMALSLAVVFLLMQYLNLFVTTYPAAGSTPQTYSESQVFQSIGIASGIVQISMLMSMAFLAIRRWGATLPFGVFTFIFAFIGIALATQKDTYWLVLAMLLAGLTADMMIAQLKPSEERRSEVRIFAIGVPLVLYISYFVILAATSTIWWSMHTIAGTVVSATSASLLLSYLAFMPTTKTE